MSEIEKRKQEMQELKEVCKPVVEFLKKKHPYGCELCSHGGDTVLHR